MSRFALIVLLVAASAACGGEPPATGPTPGKGRLDVGVLDAFFLEDSGVSIVDTGVSADGSRLDAGNPPDSGTVTDTGAGNDAATMDTGIQTDGAVDPDSGVSDTGPADTGIMIPDADGDGISDADEGNGLVDTDGDGTPDSLDADSDGDGVLDRDEAGDLDPATTPVDTDADGTPDFRDLDSDGDALADQLEGGVDTDGDGLDDRLDLDSDADGILDATETDVDSDGDGTPDFRDLDSDGDGITDLVEGDADTDGDSTANYLDDDSDGDGIDDDVELEADPDVDGLPAFLDLDSDNDLISDATEGVNDADGDGIGNFLDPDADGDTISDFHETDANLDGDSAPNYLDLDSDGDGISDSWEAGDAILASPPLDNDFDGDPNFLDIDADDDSILDNTERRTDPDGDGVPNYLDIDSDNDSVLDFVEAGDTDLQTPPVNTDGDANPDYLDTDSDNDRISDLYERAEDTDGDGVDDRLDFDSDNDTILDVDEAGDSNLQTPPIDTDGDLVEDFRDLDSDDDGLADAMESGCPASTERALADSDGDGFIDPAEVAYGSNPCSGASTIDDFYFVLAPLGPADDAPLIFDDTGIDRADLAINVDTTGSMGGEIANLQTSLTTVIIPGVQAEVPSPAFAVSSFEDYPILPFGSAAAGDIPFRLGTRVTTDGVSAQAAVNALTTRNGQSLPESGLEALHQIATGLGTSWNAGNVAAFDPAINEVPGVADGAIGGVGFRNDALPIVVHVTDAVSHLQADYIIEDPSITAVGGDQVQTTLDGIGARVVTIANQELPLSGGSAIAANVQDLCDASSSSVQGRLDAPNANDVDYFELVGALAGDTVIAEIRASRLGSPLDSTIAVYDGAQTQIGFNDDIVPGQVRDSSINFVLTGVPPYYVTVSAFGDNDFDGTGAESNGFYFLDVTVDGVAFSNNPHGCRADDGGVFAMATPLVANSIAAPNQAQCMADCSADLVGEALRLPYGISELTNAVIPTCSWDEFGTRPVTCAANECCTGLAGAGVPPNANGECPLSFQVDDQGTGLGVTVVDAIEALVNFSAFTITTVVRPDPTELSNTGIDTSCFIHGVIPQSTTPPNTCAPTPTAVDLFAPSPQLDSFVDVVPGTVLTFQVNAENRAGATTEACADAVANPRLFRAFIDVVADGVTVVDTRNVIIIVPPAPPTGQN